MFVIYIRAIHFERQPHKYAVSWTIHRTPDIQDGCHFYLAKYGIHIQQSSNTLIIWQPKEPHGTSIPDIIHPGDCDPTNFCQRGMAFVTSNRLKSAWVKLQAGEITRKQALELAEQVDEDYEEYQ